MFVQVCVCVKTVGLQIVGCASQSGGGDRHERKLLFFLDRFDPERRRARVRLTGINNELSMRRIVPSKKFKKKNQDKKKKKNRRREKRNRRRGKNEPSYLHTIITESDLLGARPDSSTGIVPFRYV